MVPVPSRGFVSSDRIYEREQIMHSNYRVSTILTLLAFAALAALLAGCGDDDPAAPSDPTPTVIHVNGTTGNDTTGTGSAAAPYQTITMGLSVAESGDIVEVAPGLYGYRVAESFPLNIRDGVILAGTDSQRCGIAADTDAQSVGLFIFMQCDDCEVRNFTFRDFTIGDTKLGYYFNMDGCNGALVDSVHCLLGTNYATFRISDDNGSTIQNSLIQNSTPANWVNRGITLLNSNTTFRNVTVNGFDEGLFIARPGKAPLVEGCVFTNNNDGVSIYGGGDISDQSNPDFGGGARSGIGGNHFYDNQRTGLRNLTLHTIYARFNTWTNDPPVAGIDYVSAHGGTVITQ